MSRNHYTRLVHAIEDDQHIRLEKELAVLAHELHRSPAIQPEPPSVTAVVKERRRIRRDRNLRTKPARPASTPPQATEPDTRAAA